MTTWHLDPTLVAAYADGSLDDPRAYSIEAHLLGCTVCRTAVADAFDATRLEEVWGGIVAELDAPVPGPIERLLLRLGVPDHIARLLAATPTLSLAWVGAVAAALGFAVLAAHVVGTDRALLAFLGVAPLVPVVGVAVAYGPRVDPSHELGIATPMQGWHLLALRAVAVLGVSVVLVGLAATALPALGWIAAAWLLPALGGTLATLALSTFVAPHWAAGGVAWAWLAVVGLTARTSAAPLDLFDLPTQLASAGLAIAALVVTLGRRDAFDTVR